MKLNYLPEIVKVRQDYNHWVATETLEDYALRFAPKSFRKWPSWLVANTAIGGISFLALEAIGGSLMMSYGFANTFWAIVFVGIIIFLVSFPISYYAAKYSIDMDLLTRGAGFGYIGSTITSLIYASFTFIFFALEATIMAQALVLYWHWYLSLAYLFCSLIIIPLVFFGITLINKIQLWTQPIWLILLVLPYIFVIEKDPNIISKWMNLGGEIPQSGGFNFLFFGSAATVSFSLIAQIGEQVDYLRFLPEPSEKTRIQWWLSLILAGPGWIIIGVAKQLGGAFLAFLVISQGMPREKAIEPIQMYLAGFSYVFDDPAVILGVGTLFVVVSQIKINITNAYAGSLAWSNFFSRMTHSHPGRVVWLVFNIIIALVFTELGVFETLQVVLGIYSNVALAWIGALVADLVINKSLGLSPSYIEFKRAYLYNFNPVGVGSTLIASLVSLVSFQGWLGTVAQSYCSFIALGLAFILAPIIALITKGKYYLARENLHFRDNSSLSTVNCAFCHTEYEAEDMAFCSVYNVNICSLCCTLETRCHDGCKRIKLEDKEQETKELTDSFESSLSKLIGTKFSPKFGTRLGKFVSLFLLISAISGFFFWLVYDQPMSQKNSLIDLNDLKILLLKLYALLSILNGVWIWWLVLTLESWQLAEEVVEKQNLELQKEILERKQVEKALRESEDKLRYDTFHDSLTGLANRALLMENLNYALKRRERHQDDLCAVLFLDLDRFKVINDSLGHLVGDLLLIEIAKRLTVNQRTGDLIARLGGDEFVILLQDITHQEDAIKVAERIQKILTPVFQLDSHEITISTSIGIAFRTSDYNTPNQLLRAADTALYHAKGQGKNCYAVFDDSMHTESVRQLSLESDLRQAQERQEWVVYYQPIIDLATHRIEGVEALIRWQHPKLGLIPPNEFIPLAEETGLIIELDRWVLHTACRQMTQWKEQFPDSPLKTVSVNLSSKQFEKSDLIACIDKILMETGFGGQQLKLEITETVLITNPKRTENFFIQLKERGIQICLDDFGTGYSSLSYLHRFPIDVVKLDRIFVRDLGNEEKNMAIVRMVGTLGKEMKFELIAEGIETLEQRDILKSFGYKWGQGYWYSPPVERERLEEFLISDLNLAN